MATVTKRGNTYKITVSCGYDTQGRQVRKSMTWKPAEGMTKRQIEKELDRQAVIFEERVRNGQVLSGSIKFADFAEQWVNEYAQKQLRAKTVAQYQALLPRINAAIGHLRLDRIQPYHLISFYNELSEDGVRKDTKYLCKIDFKAYLKEHNLTKCKLAESAGVNLGVLDSMTKGKNISEPSADKICAVLHIKRTDLFNAIDKGKLSGKTLHHYHTLISSILSTAVQWQIINSNPCTRVKPPKMERKEALYLDEIQAGQLLNALDKEPILYRALFNTIIYSGMRRGEACGLEWSDVDFENGLIDINKSSLYLPSKGIYEDDTKNTSSRRVIKLPLTAIQLLKEYKTYQTEMRLKIGDRWQGSKKVFTTEDGRPLHPDTASGWFAKFTARHNLPHITVHSLRHTNATLMIANGTDIKTVSKRLGHADISTTGNIYTHAIKSADELAASRLDDIFRKQA